MQTCIQKNVPFCDKSGTRQPVDNIKYAHQYVLSKPFNIPFLTEYRKILLEHSVKLQVM